MQMYKIYMDTAFNVDYLPIGNMPISYNSTQFLYQTYNNTELDCSKLQSNIGSLKTIHDLEIPSNQSLNDQICINQHLSNKLASSYTLHSGADERYLNTKFEYNTQTVSIITITLGIAQFLLLQFL